MKRIPMNALIAFAGKVLQKRGMPETDAAYVARFIVETEAFRSTTHGLAQLGALEKNLGESIVPGKKPRVVRETGAMALLDGMGVSGLISMKAAVEQAMARARKTGVGFAGVRNTYWVGSLGSHLLPIAGQGFLAMAFAQTNTCKDCAPLGGIDARFSTNPLAIAFPTAKGPVLADFSTATYSMAAVSRMIAEKKKSAIPRFIDGKGRPSRDPSVMNRGGSIMFTGLDLEGHKFYGLSLFIEALTVMCGGSANNPKARSHQSVSLIVLDPRKFAGAAYYGKEMARFIAHVKRSRVRPGFDAVRLPGERGLAALAEARKKGVPVDDAKLRMLEEIAKENGVPVTW